MSDRQSNKERRQSFREKTEKRERITSERDGGSYKNEI